MIKRYFNGLLLPNAKYTPFPSTNQNSRKVDFFPYRLTTSHRNVRKLNKEGFFAIENEGTIQARNNNNKSDALDAVFFHLVRSATDFLLSSVVHAILFLLFSSL
jgi:hypothetical protein